ncbi:unnamed protein product [Macrosiphum euphorbiae]|uniref:Uncharacterized protein n=1 Tax=Macrosiphum euphorbiae TaxID=13131 RepID=A0AAV0XZ13_9HEMI|nr:unnamed protein product [Macrosiphum euphorbiae]
MNWELYTNSSEMKKQESAYESITSIKYFETNSVGQSLDIDFTDRNKTIIEQLITDHLNQEELKALTDLCYEYSDVFYVEGDKIVGTDLVTHRIITHRST